ncbi:MAG TPA: hypothetical protein VLT87_13815 [Thermoanaerobaculia bacterium]|nr:hypothetical protein [Thermoanaerobaculia bacterium]
MSPGLSIADIVARLEAQLAVHQEKEAFHAGQEALHREQRSVHAAEVEKLTRSLETFRASAAEATELADRVSPRRKTVAVSGGTRLSVNKMAAAVVADFGPHEPFGTRKVTAEITRQFQDSLREPVDPRMVSLALARMAKSRQIHRLRPGKPHHEAVYALEKEETGKKA